MKCYVLRRLRIISLGMLCFLGFFGWTHLIPTFFSLEDKGQLLIVMIPVLVILLVVLFDHTVLNQISFKMVCFVWFVGTGYSGGLDLIQQQHSTLLLIAFQIFAFTPIFLACLYWVLMNKQQHSK